jgi:hypothetical protein
MQLKADISAWFIRDGSDLLEIFATAWKSDRNNLSYRSKLFVNLRMAIECYLKGLVIVYSEETESPEDAYKAVRTASHGLAQLLEEVQSRGKWAKGVLRRASDELIAKVDRMKVGLRYEADLTAAFSTETFEEQMLDSGPTSGTIGSDDWMLSLREHAEYIGTRTCEAFREKFHEHRRCLGADHAKLWKRRLQFMNNVGLC